MIPQFKLRLALVAAGLAVAMPVHAQDNTSADIGPSELSNFSLNGSVTRPADRPAVTVPAPQPTAPAATAQPAPTQQQAAPTRTQPTATAPASEAAPRRSNADDILSRPPTLPQAGPARPGTTNAVAGAAAAPSLPIAPPEGGFSILPWIAALLFAAGGGVLIWYLRQKRGQRYAGAGADYQAALDPTPVAPTPAPTPVARTAPTPGPRHDPVPDRPAPSQRTPLPTTLMPKPAAPAPAPEPAPTGGIVSGAVTSGGVSAGGVSAGGIVSTGLRPWIEIDLVPERALFDDDGAAIAFDIILVNSGNAPARDVTIEARLLNAGNQQDMELSAFFASPKTVSDPIPLIAPFAKIGLRSAVRIPRANIREYEVEGRKLFVPMVGVSARYRWSSGDGQTGAGFLVGRGGEDADKLGPLRIDQGSRSWDGLGVRRYEKGVRR